MIRSARWVGAVALVAMLLGVGVSAGAKDCSNATLLPVDTAITPPAADVPAELAQFSGAWGGAWTDRAGRPGACTALVVEDVFANGYVRVVLANSVGVVDPHMLQPRDWRAAGRVVAGTLRFELPIPTRPEFTYRFAGNDLAGTARDGTVERIVTATRIPDLRQVACPRLPPIALPSGAAHDRLLATELLASTWAGDGPVHNDYFMPMAVPSAPLSAAELQAQRPGNTFGTGGLRVFIAPGGVQYLAVGTRVDVGRWRITPDGRYCRAWTVADDGRERCHRVYRDGETFTFHVHDRWTVFRWTRTSGRPADL